MLGKLSIPFTYQLFPLWKFIFSQYQKYGITIFWPWFPSGLIMFPIIKIVFPSWVNYVNTVLILGNIVNPWWEYHFDTGMGYLSFPVSKLYSHRGLTVFTSYKNSHHGLTVFTGYQNKFPVSKLYSHNGLTVFPSINIVFPSWVACIKIVFPSWVNCLYRVSKQIPSIKTVLCMPPHFIRTVRYMIYILFNYCDTEIYTYIQ